MGVESVCKNGGWCGGGGAGCWQCHRRLDQTASLGLQSRDLAHNQHSLHIVAIDNFKNCAGRQCLCQGCNFQVQPRSQTMPFLQRKTMQSTQTSHRKKTHPRNSNSQPRTIESTVMAITWTRMASSSTTKNRKKKSKTEKSPKVVTKKNVNKIETWILVSANVNRGSSSGWGCLCSFGRMSTGAHGSYTQASAWRPTPEIIIDRIARIWTCHTTWFKGCKKRKKCGANQT